MPSKTDRNNDPLVSEVLDIIDRDNSRYKVAQGVATFIRDMLTEKQAIAYDRGKADGVTDTVDRITSMASSKQFGKWTQDDIANFFIALGEWEREVRAIAATPPKEKS